MRNCRIFLDTNFLIASQLKKHIFHEKAKNVLEQMYLENSHPVTHSIVFDEFWYVLKGIENSKSSVYKKMKLVTEKVFMFKNFCLLQTSLNQTELIDTLDLAEKYKLRPRDAIIAEIMKKEDIHRIASFDSDFKKIPALKVIH
ncbi:type II toxin-antitoxin system VapC family toxin [Patescibacteria group bacterium]|nr:type II toxin-antitoxin system VapC family toxin [Patescibacteria group bacterium]